MVPASGTSCLQCVIWKQILLGPQVTCRLSADFCNFLMSAMWLSWIGSRNMPCRKRNDEVFPLEFLQQTEVSVLLLPPEQQAWNLAAGPRPVRQHQGCHLHLVVIVLHQMDRGGQKILHRLSCEVFV